MICSMLLGILDVSSVAHIFPVSCYNTELATWVRSCVASALECEGIVYFCVNVRDLVLFAIGSLVFWIV